MILVPLQQIAWSDFEALVATAEPEGRDIEYKEATPSGADSDKLEFLADISSLANTNGGDLIFGVREEGGNAVEAPGIEVDNADSLILRLEAMVRDGLEPRLTVQSRWVPHPGESNKGILIMRLPASLAAPHRIRFKNSGKFFSRLSRAKQEMDVHQLRDAFLASADLPSRLRKIHTEWVDDAQRNRPLTLIGGADIHLTIVPISVLRERLDLALTLNATVFPPVMGSAIDYTQTLDGWLNFVPPNDKGAVWSYVLTARRGYVQASFNCGNADHGGHFIFTDDAERAIYHTVENSVDKLTALGVDGPWAVFMTMNRVEHYTLHFGPYSHNPVRKIQLPSTLSFPEQFLDAVSEESVMPLLRLMWYAFGVERPQGRPVGGKS